MKFYHILIAFIISFGFSQRTHAQQKVTEEKLLGTWKLVINIEDELEEEAEEEENPFARMVIQGVSGFVGGILENLDIYFDFQSDGEVKITVNAFGEEEVEYGKWTINRYGELIIEDLDNDNIQFDNDDVWMLEGSNRLVSFEDDGSKEKNVYMMRIE